MMDRLVKHIADTRSIRYYGQQERRRNDVILVAKTPQVLTYCIGHHRKETRRTTHDMMGALLKCMACDNGQFGDKNYLFWAVGWALRLLSIQDQHLCAVLLLC
jgi:hypothetical protein